MGALHQLVIILAAATAMAAIAENKTEKGIKDNTIRDEIYEGYDEEYDIPEEVLFSEDKPCPRDCICEKAQGYKIAKCNRLELGTQKFGDDVTDLIVEHLDSTMQLNLEDEMFKKLGLHQLSTIKIINTTIGYISPSAFHGLHELYAITLTGNRLKTIHPDTFAKNRKLILLTLSENPIEFPAKGTDGYFLNSTTVQELDISKCNMRHIAPYTFSQMKFLMYLNVANNQLSSLDKLAFRPLSDLEELDLSDNLILDLPGDLFMYNTELATLHIQRNPIETVYGLTVKDIVTLNAGQTNIKFVGPSMFNGLTYISNLNLSANGIKKIHNQAFHKLQELNFLDLSYNDLDYVSPYLIEQNIELDILKISNNPRLKQLPKYGFNCSADQFNVYLFDAANCGLEEISDNALRTFPALTQINLSGNKLQTISDSVFAGSTRLVEINLAFNLLTALSKNVFAQNNELSKLNLRGNPITVLSAEVFIPTPKLTWLDLSQSELISLWDENSKLPSTLLNNLLFLNISDNNIEEIEQSQIESINQLTTLDISNNPLVCNRNFELLMSWVMKYKIASTERVSLVANLARTTPKQEEDPYSWGALVKSVCNSDLNTTESLASSTSSSSASDEEIWENMASKEHKSLKQDLDNILEDGEEDDAGGEGDEEENDAAEDQDDDDDDDDDMDLDVKLLEDQNSADYKPTTDLPDDIPLREQLEMDVKILEQKTMEALNKTFHGKYDYLWPIFIVLLSVTLLLLLIGKLMMIVLSRRNSRARYNSAIIAVMNNPNRTKKDCGLVYQQLSEELVGPRTPKLSRYGVLPAPSVNVSYETSPLNNAGVPPEAV